MRPRTRFGTIGPMRHTRANWARASKAAVRRRWSFRMGMGYRNRWAATKRSASRSAHCQRQMRLIGRMRALRQTCQGRRRS